MYPEPSGTEFDGSRRPVEQRVSQSLFFHRSPRSPWTCAPSSSRSSDLTPATEPSPNRLPQGLRFAYFVHDSYAYGMRTTIDIPDEFFEEARRVSHARSKREAVIAGLQELIKKGQREELRQLAGKIDLRVDLKRSRKRRH